MRANELEAVKARLQHQRRAILDARLRTAGEIDQLRAAERDPELEEGSQSEQEQYKLSQLDEAEQAALAQIDAALQRVETGAYGICKTCGDPIAASRLQAVPFAIECADCASGREERSAVVRLRS